MAYFDKHGNEVAEELVPKAEMLRRIEAKESKYRELQSKTNDLQGKVDSAPDVAALQKRLDRAEGQYTQAVTDLEALRQETTTRSALQAAGVSDPDDQDLVMWRFSRAESEDLSKWLEGDARTDRQLARLFPTEEMPAPADGEPPAEQAAAAPSGMEQRPRALPAANVGARSQPPPPASELSYDGIQAMGHSERVERNDQIVDWLNRQA